MIPVFIVVELILLVIVKAGYYIFQLSRSKQSSTASMRIATIMLSQGGELLPFVVMNLFGIIDFEC